MRLARQLLPRRWARPCSSTSSPVLRGRCRCGACGFEGHGASVLNFYTHSSAPRAASGSPFLAASGFRFDQVRWLGGPVNDPPPGSRNPHYKCGSCGSYLGVDAERLLGIVALNLRCAAAESGAIGRAYRPTAHLFYADRVVDVQDELPKWATVVQGELCSGDERPIPALPSVPPPAWLLGSSGGAPAEIAALAARDAALPTDARIIAPFKAAEPLVYHFPEVDPPVGHRTVVGEAALAERIRIKYGHEPPQREPAGPAAQSAAEPPPRHALHIAPRALDAVIVGGGHNALTTAAYLSRAGLDVAVLERRDVLGGAAVTEELVPGFKFSRASYLAGLFRPRVIDELGLDAHGFEYLPRRVSSFTPTLVDGPHAGKHLMMGDDDAMTRASVAQWSTADADALPEYEAFLDSVRDAMQPLLDGPPPANPLAARNGLSGGPTLRERLRSATQLASLAGCGYRHRARLTEMYELVTGPAAQLLDRWFDGEVLKTTLATDAVIGAMVSPRQAGSAYVLLHHVMGEAAGRKGVWAYVRGGMGAISDSIAAAARGFGASLHTDAAVRRIVTSGGGGGGGARAEGVELVDGSGVAARRVVSGCTPYHTYMELLPGFACSQGSDATLPRDFATHVRFGEHGCGAFKINLAVSSLPDFFCARNDGSGAAGPQHLGTVHFEESMDEIENAYREAAAGVPASRPLVEMTIPSAVDETLAPPGQHVVQLFVQYAPYDVCPKVGSWADPAFKARFVRRVLDIVDAHCDGFSDSVIGVDALSPLDLERVFGLHKGNIFHGAMALHQLGHARQPAGYDYRSPVRGLFLCSAGTHPGGGVMGAAGRNCAEVVLNDIGLAI